MNPKIGIVLAVIGMGMVLGVSFTPSFLRDWFKPCSLGDCQNQPTTVIGNLENGFSHFYFYMMFFGGWIVFLKGIFEAIPSRLESKGKGDK